jgi:hypothetical protein
LIIYLNLYSIFNISVFGHRGENREDWLNIDTIGIPWLKIYQLNSIYYKNPTEFFSNRWRFISWISHKVNSKDWLILAYCLPFGLQASPPATTRQVAFGYAQHVGKAGGLQILRC